MTFSLRLELLGVEAYPYEFEYRSFQDSKYVEYFTRNRSLILGTCGAAKRAGECHPALSSGRYPVCGCESIRETILCSIFVQRRYQIESNFEWTKRSMDL